MSLDDLNAWSDERWREVLGTCCGSRAWIKEMAAMRPIKHLDDLWQLGEQTWRSLGVEDQLEAYRHHPDIGDVADLERRFASSGNLSKGEQASVATAPRQVLEEIRDGNRRYREKFGFVFLICATGKSAEQMRDALQTRLECTREEELATAASEQWKITRLRLEKML